MSSVQNLQAQQLYAKREPLDFFCLSTAYIQPDLKVTTIIYLNSFSLQILMHLYKSIRSKSKANINTTQNHDTLNNNHSKSKWPKWGRESDETEIERLGEIGAERVWQNRSSENEAVQSRERERIVSRE